MQISEIIALSGHVEKLGIIGVLVIVASLLGWAAWNFRKDLIAAHQKLEKCKLAFIIVKQAADMGGVKYDLSSLRDLKDLIGNGET